MTDDSATLRAIVRKYYDANGWPDELWAMGFEDAVKFAAHFASQSSWAKEKAELERQLKEARAECQRLAQRGDPIELAERDAEITALRRHLAEADRLVDHFSRHAAMTHELMPVYHDWFKRTFPASRPVTVRE